MLCCFIFTSAGCYCKSYLPLKNLISFCIRFLNVTSWYKKHLVRMLFETFRKTDPNISAQMSLRKVKIYDFVLA